MLTNCKSTWHPLHRMMCGPQSQVWILWRKDKSVASARNSKPLHTSNEYTTHFSDNTNLTPTPEHVCISGDTWKTKAAHKIHALHWMSFFNSLNKKFKACYTIQCIVTKYACMLDIIIPYVHQKAVVNYWSSTDCLSHTILITSVICLHIKNSTSCQLNAIKVLHCCKYQNICCLTGYHNIIMVWFQRSRKLITKQWNEFYEEENETLYNEKNFNLRYPRM